MKSKFFISSLLVFAITTSVIAQPTKSNLSSELISKINTTIQNDTQNLQNIYKDLHQHPELGFMEKRTSQIVAKELKKLGYSIQTGIAKTGVVAILKNGDGPVVMYRADMDANAVKEATGLPYASKINVKLKDGSQSPVAHMCGHDAHTTWLISLARNMVKFKDQWKGTLILVAQPAEELIEGASAMVKDGLYTKYKVPKPQYLLGLHTAPIPTGMIVGSGGLLEAGTEQLDVTFYGVGGHGSSPQYTKDPILMATYAVTEYQAIISRVLDPRDVGVITVGAFQAGTTNNVIPNQATLKLNFRFFNEKTHKQLFNGVKSISNGIAQTYGMPKDKLPKIVRKGYSSTLVNDKNFIEQLNNGLLHSGIVSKQNLITKFNPATGSEDIQMLVHELKDVKIGYLFVGTADPKLVAKAKKEGKEIPFANHNPNYQVDLDAIPFGAKVATIITMEILSKNKK
jgi:hippurate hydrolase